ncbi:bacterio-opsin activator domain-containing protein [Halomicrobium salinisoli]|uniref:bacterio-opsin activator domain-containing protein n=1 Tax=Halomicrobium salinisoli TaxID=2878391 RepID=UPI001CF049F6|nr:bacterio-opsin activator domain-containing protein [Halomicrobium salinisoli]
MSEQTPAVDATQIGAASSDGVGVVDGAEYAYANDALAAVHGREHGGDLIGQAWADLYAPEDPSAPARDLLDRARDAGEWSGRVSGRRPGGDEVPLDLTLRSTEGGVVCVARDLTDRLERERELDRYETILDTVDDGVYVLDEDLRVDTANGRFFELLAAFGFSREEVREMHAHDLVVDEDERAQLEAAIEQAIEREPHTGSFEMSAETPDGDEIVCESRFRLYPEPEGEHRGCIGILRDVTDRTERERRLERQRDELDTLNRINELLLVVSRDLFESPEQGAIEQTVCDRLADSDLYQFAWIGTPEVGSDRLVPDVSAGVDCDYVASITVTTDESETGRGPAGRAFRSGEVQVSHDVATDPTFEPWREAALDRDVRSAAAVPLTYDGTTYGVLAVYADRPLAFSRREQRGFEILGEAIGYAINATRTRQLLFAERVVELELRLTAPNELVVEAAERLGCRLSLEGYVATGDESWLLYFALSGAEADRFIDVAGPEAAVEVVRSDGDGSERIVAIRTRSQLLDSIGALGGRVTGGTIDDGRGTFVVEIPQSTDVREFVEQARSSYPGTELLAKREHERSVERLAWLCDDTVDLTDRQRQALEAAHHAGYFEWPRESTAEDVADLLDIARPTLQAHLRKAEQELVAAFIAAGSGPANREAKSPLTDR